MSIKKSLAYLVYTIFLLGLFIYIGELILDIEAEVSTSAGLTPLYFFPLVYFPLGLLLGLPIYSTI
ncbi:hypothetical protein CR203_11960 [Salipaludibacillus neizhouensis]|uniref:Uncharacterized protein n=1 Tax=Salipaludibacillus neizhouensis TaxID=885475 RepID=A0A3A9K3J1_9BACI|nr:hypothetical protein [Salipaludibacillus neizhouensis]RKL67217.1 hypothetical protein CR203_11960 [Salipaludibacillus neizhouensis]